jgi:hypothetical protein
MNVRTHKRAQTCARVSLYIVGLRQVLAAKKNYHAM